MLSAEVAIEFTEKKDPTAAEAAVPADEFVLLYERDSCDCELLQGEASAGVHPALPGCMVFALFWAVVWLVVGFGLMFLLYQL